MSLRITALFALLVLAALPASAPRAQDPRYGNGYDDAVDCRSQNYSLQRCPVPWRDARIVQQLSNTQCVRGMNWGVDRGGIWVDRGCAGRFVARGGEAGGWRPPSGWDQRFEVCCDSNDYQYNFCAVDVGRGGRVYMRRQVSGSPCIEGQSWGWNRAGVWVVQGCAAVFTIDRHWR